MNRDRNVSPTTGAYRRAVGETLLGSSLSLAPSGPSALRKFKNVPDAFVLSRWGWVPAPGLESRQDCLSYGRGGDRRRRIHRGGKVERVMGIEPTLRAWEAPVLPLNYTRIRNRLYTRPAREGRKAKDCLTQRRQGAKKFKTCHCCLDPIAVGAATGALARPHSRRTPLPRNGNPRQSVLKLLNFLASWRLGVRPRLNFSAQGAGLLKWRF
jgi:hypothetical protein